MDVKAGRKHLSPGIAQVIDAFEANDLSALHPAFGDEGMSILRRWWRGEELGIACVVGDIWSPAGVLGEEVILAQARCARFRAGAPLLRAVGLRPVQPNASAPLL